MQSANSHNPEEDCSLMADQELWELLDKVPRREPSPQFTQNVLREARRSELDASSPSKSFLASLWLQLSGLQKSFLVAASVIVATLTIGSILKTGDQGEKIVQQKETENLETAAALAEIETDFEEGLLLAAAESPERFSDAELISLLF